jgi:hypothetical protein
MFLRIAKIVFHFQSKQKLNFSLNNYFYSLLTKKIVIFETKNNDLILLRCKNSQTKKKK